MSPVCVEIWEGDRQVQSEFGVVAESGGNEKNNGSYDHDLRNARVYIP